MTAVDVRTFDHLAARYDRISTLLGAELRAWLMFHLPARGDRALDLGCGTGVQTAMLADRFDEVLAVDLSAPMIDFARQRRPRSAVRYEQRDLRERPVQRCRQSSVRPAHHRRGRRAVHR